VLEQVVMEKCWIWQQRGRCTCNGLVTTAKGRADNLNKSESVTAAANSTKAKQKSKYIENYHFRFVPFCYIMRDFSKIDWCF